MLPEPFCCVLFILGADLNKQLLLIEERMRGLGFTEQRMQDILSLVRLRILGDKMKKRSKKAYKVCSDEN